MSWFKSLFNATDSSASLKHVAYGAVIASAVFWLTKWLFAPGPDGNWVAAFAALLAAVTTGKVMGSSQTPKDEQLPQSGDK